MFGIKLYLVFNKIFCILLSILLYSVHCTYAYNTIISIAPILFKALARFLYSNNFQELIVFRRRRDEG